MSGEGYEGWTNRDTWLVNLWLSNDYSTYMHLIGMAQELNELDMPRVNLMAQLVRTTAVAEINRGHITDEIDQSKVDWREVASHWLEDAKDF